MIEPVKAAKERMESFMLLSFNRSDVRLRGLKTPPPVVTVLLLYKLSLQCVASSCHQSYHKTACAYGESSPLQRKFN